MLIIFPGPFNNEEDFNATIADAYTSKSKGHVDSYIRGTLNSHNHSIAFTHGDLRRANIIVKDGRLAAIIDWELAGWYPTYWEFARAFFLEEAIATDWEDHLQHILTPYYCEQMMYAKSVVWMW